MENADLIEVLIHQRNGAMDDAAQQAAARRVAERRVIELERQVKELEAKLPNDKVMQPPA